MPSTAFSCLPAPDASSASALPNDSIGSGRCQSGEVLFAFSARVEGELTLEEGEAVYVEEPGEAVDGWMLGSRRRDGARGYFPAEYVRLVAAETAESSATMGSFTTIATSHAHSSILRASQIGKKLAIQLDSVGSRGDSRPIPLQADVAGALQGGAADTLVVQQQDATLAIGSAGTLSSDTLVALQQHAAACAIEDDVPTVAPWDSISCIGEQSMHPDEIVEADPGISSWQSVTSRSSRGIRLKAADGSTAQTGGVRVVRPANLQALLAVVKARADSLWPGSASGAPHSVRLVDADGCDLDDENFALVEDGALVLVHRIEPAGSCEQQPQPVAVARPLSSENKSENLVASRIHDAADGGVVETRAQVLRGMESDAHESDVELHPQFAPAAVAGEPSPRPSATDEVYENMMGAVSAVGNAAASAGNALLDGVANLIGSATDPQRLRTDSGTTPHRLRTDSGTMQALQYLAARNSAAAGGMQQNPQPLQLSSASQLQPLTAQLPVVGTLTIPCAHTSTQTRASQISGVSQSTPQHCDFQEI